jgi:GT2 family glycosyltransferase
MAKVAVVTVPFIRNFDQYLFMVETVESLRRNSTEHELDLIAIVNKIESNQQAERWIEKNFDYTEVNDRNIVARAWNKGIETGFSRGASYCLVINLDITFHSLFVQNLISFAQAQPEAIAWSGQSWNNLLTLEAAPLVGEPINGIEFCAFLIDKRLREVVGLVDEIFEPAYHEDADMAYRVGLKGLTMLRTPSAPFFHFENITYQSAIMQCDEPYIEKFKNSVEGTRSLYERKWGGPPGQELFRVPYNRVDG